MVNDYLRFALKILFTGGILRRFPLWFSGTYPCIYWIPRSSILKIRTEFEGMDPLFWLP